MTEIPLNVLQREMVQEQWRPVAGWPYEVSHLGRIRSMSRWTRNRYAGFERPGRVLRPGRSTGCMLVVLCRPGESSTLKVHAVVAAAFLGERPAGAEVCHGPAGWTENAVGNIAYGTHRENMWQRHRDGTMLHGERHPMAKLSEAVVDECRQRRGAGATYRSLACEFGVDYKTIWDAVNGVTWKGSDPGWAL